MERISTSGPHRARRSPEPAAAATPGARWLLVAILLLAAGVRLAIWSRPVDALDGRTIPDDAYLALEIAKNLGQGRGPVYGGTVTNGFQPLYVLLAAFEFRGATAAELRDPVFLDTRVKLALALTLVADLLCILLLAAILARRLGWSAATLCGAALWATQPLFVRTCLNGLETSLAMLLLLLAWWWLEARGEERSGLGARLVLGLLLGLGTLARIDLALFALWVAAIPTWRLWRAERRLGPAIGWLLPVAAGALLAYGPWLVYSWRATGLLLPISGQAVRFMSLARAGHHPDIGWYLESAWLALGAVYRNSALLWIVAVGLVVATALERWRRGSIASRERWNDRRWLALPVLFGATLLAAYAFFIPAFWFFDRYLFPLALVAVVLVAAGLDRWLRLYGVAGHTAVSLAVVALSALLGTASSELRALLDARYEPWRGYRQIGLWAARRFPAGTVIGASQSGALAYYAPDLEVVNLDGVVNRAAYRSLVERRHFDYLRERGVQYVLGWGENIRFVANHSEPGTEDDLVYLETIRNRDGVRLRSWWNEWLVYEVKRR